MRAAEAPADDSLPPRHRTSQQRRRWWIHLVILGSYPVLAAVLGAGRTEARTPALGRTPWGLLIVCSYQIGMFAVLFGLAWLASHVSRSDLKLRWRPGIWVLPLGIAYSLGLRLALATIAAFVVVALATTQVIRLQDLQQLVQTNRPNVGALVDVAALRNNPAYFWLNLTLVSFVVAGLREELWRAAMLAGLRSLWPDWFFSYPGEIAAVGVTSALFGLGHLSQGPVAVGAAALLGFGLGTIMVLHRSIWPAVIAHGLFDATTFAVLPWLMEQLPRVR